MFDDIGWKIKWLAKVLCALGIIASVIGAFVLWGANSRYESTIGTGILVLIGGCIGSWVGSFFMYGFGELIDQQTTAAYELAELHKAVNALSNSSDATNASTAKPITVSSNHWTCPKCGQSNPKRRGSCSACGCYK